MSELFLLYLWTRLDAISSILSGVLYFSIIATVGLGIARGVHFIVISDGVSHGAESWQKKEAEKAEARIGPLRRGFKWAATLLATSLILGVVVPSRNDALLIGGGYIVLKAAQNEDVRARVGRIADLVEAEVEARITELADRKEKK